MEQSRTSIQQQDYPAIGRVGHHLLRDLYRYKKESDRSRLALTLNSTVALREASDTFQEALQPHDEQLLRERFFVLRPIVDTLLEDYLANQDKQIAKCPPSLLRQAYLLWARMYLDLVRTQHLHAHALFVELPIAWENFIPTYVVDALELETINGYTPDRSTVELLRELSQEKYYTLGHATYAVAQHFTGLPLSFVVNEYKVSDVYDPNQKAKRLGDHIAQLQNYVVLANVVDADINQLLTTEDGWPIQPRISAGNLHYASIPMNPERCSIEIHRVKALDRSKSAAGRQLGIRSRRTLYLP